MATKFVVAAVPAARIDDARKHTLLQIVSELTEDAIDGDSEMWFDDLGEYRAALEQAVEFLVNAPNAREVILFGIPGADYNVLLTGSSCGDAPTPTMEMFYWINTCQALVEKLEEWANEDLRASCEEEDEG